MKKYFPYILIGALIILFGYLIYKLIQNNTQPAPPAPQPGQQPNLIQSIISGAANLIKGWFGTGSSNNEPGVVNCDPNNPGYDVDGSANPNCGKDYTNCDSSKCDPNRSGFNQCGFLDLNCF